MSTEAPAAEVAEAAERAGSPRISLIAAAVLAVVVALLVAVLASSDPQTERQTQSPLLGRLAPPTEGRTLDGQEVSIDDYRGRWVFVNFFASWCIPCQTEHRQLRAFDEAHRRSGDAALVGVTYDNDTDEARAFFEERGGEWPVIDDPTNSIGVAYGVARVPETFVIAPDGTVVHRFPGEVTRKQLDEVIQLYEERAA
ncbi:MAG: TlpA disulfide reductase family protein [Acidimicrobiales bacterium]|nr:TlpA disulfide reductase family protein [Acidimicrobiales bacterium]